MCLRLEYQVASSLIGSVPELARSSATSGAVLDTIAGDEDNLEAWGLNRGPGRSECRLRALGAARGGAKSNKALGTGRK